MKALLFAFCLGMLAPVAGAGAADLYVPQSESQPYTPASTVSEASGWYLRGDVGYSFNDIRGGYYFNGGNYTNINRTHVGNAFLVGLGAGYRLTRHFRVDFTGDYMFHANYRNGTNCAGGCTSVDRTHVNMLSLLANAYVDLGTWHGVTPYVGAGIGGTHVDWGHFTTTGCGAGGPCGGGGGYDGAGSWRFTYALMAGASVDLTCNLKLDAGYRFRHVEGGRDSVNIPLNGRAYDKGFGIHDVRAGLRYTFGGCPAPQYASYEPAPAPVYK